MERALSAMRRADVVVALVDASEGITQQVRRVGGALGWAAHVEMVRGCGASVLCRCGAPVLCVFVACMVRLWCACVACARVHAWVHVCAHAHALQRT